MRNYFFGSLLLVTLMLFGACGKEIGGVPSDNFTNARGVVVGQGPVPMSYCIQLINGFNTPTPTDVFGVINWRVKSVLRGEPYDLPSYGRRSALYCGYTPGMFTFSENSKRSGVVTRIVPPKVRTERIQDNVNHRVIELITLLPAT